jgi:hypothetical protein
MSTLGHVPANDEEGSSVVEAASTRGGITGTMCPRTMLNMFRALQGKRTCLLFEATLPPHYLFKTIYKGKTCLWQVQGCALPEKFKFVEGVDTFVDAGSGSGAPCLGAALVLKPRAVLGVDNCRLQVLFSTLLLDQARKTGVLATEAIYFSQGNLVEMKDFACATHLFSFFGDPVVVGRVAWLLATSKLIRVAALMCLRKDPPERSKQVLRGPCLRCALLPMHGCCLVDLFDPGSKCSMSGIC